MTNTNTNSIVWTLAHHWDGDMSTSVFSTREKAALAMAADVECYVQNDTTIEVTNCWIDGETFEKVNFHHAVLKFLMKDDSTKIEMVINDELTYCIEANEVN